jgi:hypothetical protein
LGIQGFDPGEICTLTELKPPSPSLIDGSARMISVS